MPKHDHGNPDHLEAYLAKLEHPSRDEWQLPDEVVRALALEPGETVCDAGAGPGYFSLRLAHALGERGRVFAVEVSPPILDVLRSRLASANARTVTPILGLPDDPLVPPASCELALVVDTFHHFPDGVAYLERLARTLKPGGRLANIDFHKRELPVGPRLEHKVAREDFLHAAADAGFELQSECDFLPHQYFLILRLARKDQNRRTMI